VVYIGFASQSTQRLFLRARDQIQPAVLLTTGAPTPRGPFSSPDGKRIGFLDLGPGGPELKIVPVEGGPAISVCPLDNTPSAGATWGDDDTIIFATGNLSTGLYRVSANGGHPEVLTKPDRARRERDHVWPHFLPRGRAVLFTITPAADTEEPRLAVLDLSTGRTKSLNLPGSQAHYTASGHLVYLAGATLFAVPFDLDRLEVRGTPTPLPIRVATTSSGTAEFDIGRDGTLAYVPAGATNATAPRTLVWVDRHGREEPIRGAGPRAYMHPRLSPDGSQLAVTIADQDSRIYVWDFAREHLTRVTFEPGFQGVPVWIDRRTVAYTSILVSGVIGRLYRRAVDGTGNAEAIASADPAPPGLVPSSVYGGTLLAWTIMGSSDVLKLTLNDRSLTSWYQTPYTERNAEISPDGRWVAYEAANPGQAAQFNIYVRPFAHPDDRLVEISTSGGRQPAWNRNGTELFFMGSDGTLYSVGFNPETGVAETPLPALPSPYYQGTIAGMFAARMYDISKDGRLLMLKEAESDRSPSRASIIVTQNWLEELQRLVPAR
jgi:serine/threonine-protein kinase